MTAPGQEGPPARPGDAAPEGGERLQKILARAGVGSRRTCEGLIEDGRVEVNGEVATLGRRVDPEHDRVTIDGVTIPVRPGLVYYLLNKPAKVVTTAHDPEGRPTVMDLVPAEPRVFPVGRLDWDTEGLLLLTNDGDLAHDLTHPSRGVPKTYLAEVTGSPGRAALRRLREGVDLDDGRTAPARVRVAQTTPTAARSAGCARRSATLSAASSGPGSAPSTITGSPRLNGGLLAGRKFGRCMPPSPPNPAMGKRIMRFEMSLVAQALSPMCGYERFVAR